jgi:hypothetical protein
MPSMLQPRIIWAAIGFSQMIFAGLLFAGIFQRPAEPPQPILLTAIAAVAMVNAVLSLVLPRFLLGQAIRAMREREPALGDHGPDVVRRRAFQVSMTPTILGLALAESVSIFGLVIGVLGFGTWQAAPFFAAGIALTAIQFPMEGRFIRPVLEAYGVR